MQIETQVHCPRTPNFIITNNGKFDIADFSDEQLEEIGEMWTKELLKRANERR